MPERYEFYKARGKTIAVSTCECCRDGRFQDGWMHEKGKTFSCGFSPSGLKEYTLITQAEAIRRVHSFTRFTED
ncbi:hypothetical protein ACTG4Q_20940 [Bradyrhizobium denitrificans]